MREIPTFRAGAAAFAALLFAAAGTLATHARANDKTHGNGKYGNDGEILAQLVAIDENEVHAAQLAEKKDVEGAVESYAKMIREDHGKNINDTEKLADKLNIDLKKGDPVDSIHTQGEQMLDRLDDVKGGEFERSFLSEMINGHRDALDKLDDFIRMAQNPEVKQHLQATRERVAFHLKEAERLQASGSTHS
jgi:putative membrane protein